MHSRWIALRPLVAFILALVTCAVAPGVQAQDDALPEGEIPTAPLDDLPEIGDLPLTPPPATSAEGAPAPAESMQPPAQAAEANAAAGTPAPPPPEAVAAPPVVADETEATQEIPQAEPPIVAETAPEPTEAERSNSEPPLSKSEARARKKLRAYERHVPAGAIGAQTSLSPWGDTGTLPSGVSRDALTTLSLLAEWQPASIQKIGVLGIGMTGSLTLGQDLAKDVPAYAIGAQARYQARFFREQLLVPMAGYQASYQIYNFGSASGAFLAKGPMFGAMLLLNGLEPSAAAEAFVSTGISRTYLLAEAQQLEGSDENASMSGRSYFFGLRFEF